MDDRFSLINMTRGKLPSLPFAEMKDDILGKNYSLSIACVNEKKSQEINKEHRGKDKPTNVLSFSLKKNEGEIVLCPSVIKKEIMKKLTGERKTFPEFFGFLVIHGMLHLKGMSHGAIMEKEESKHDQKYFSGHRHRNSLDKSRSGRIRKGRKKS